MINSLKCKIRICLLLAAVCLLAGCATGQETNNPQEAAVFAAAETYRGIYEDVYPGDHTAVWLTDETMREILSCLGAAGYTAVDVSNRFAMEHAEPVSAFLAAMEAGGDARLTIYQVCWDGGFVCHDLSHTDGSTWVTLTRLAWLSEGDYALTGDIPTICYSDTYAVTAIALSDDDWLEYAYDMPDNPPGDNHDGHIDTIYQIAVSAS